MTAPTLGSGIYTFAEAGRLTGLAPRRVRDWFRGRPITQKAGRRSRVFDADYSDAAGGRISFLDLIEVLVAGNLRELGIPLRGVRKAHAELRRFLHTPHPFSHRGLFTDGRAIFLHMEDRSRSDSELIEVVSRQQAIPQVLLPQLTRVDYDPGSALARQWRVAAGVVIDPARSFGKPVTATSGVPTSILAAAFRANGRDAERVADWYGISAADVNAAVRFEAEHFGGERRRAKAA